MDIRLSHLTKIFADKNSEVKAVDDLSFSVNKGELFAFLGVNGAGKTTLMRMICTLLTPTSGQILCDGRDIQKMEGEYRNLLGYLPQEFGYYPDFSVKDYLLYIAGLKGIGEVKLKAIMQQVYKLYEEARE